MQYFDIVAYLYSYCKVIDPSITTRPPPTTQQNLKTSSAPQVQLKLVNTSQSVLDTSTNRLMLVVLTAVVLVFMIFTIVTLACFIKRKTRNPNRTPISEVLEAPPPLIYATPVVCQG